METSHEHNFFNPTSKPEAEDPTLRLSLSSSSSSSSSIEAEPRPDHNLRNNQSPPTQIMERSTNDTTSTPTYRIPSHVFETTTSTAPLEWSTLSNESLFSIRMGNNSFTEIDYFKSGELTFPQPPSPRTPHMPSPRHHTNQAGVAEEAKTPVDVGKKAAETDKAYRASKDEEQKAAASIREVIMANEASNKVNNNNNKNNKLDRSVSRRSEDLSVKSFAFQKLGNADKGGLQGSTPQKRRTSQPESPKSSPSEYSCRVKHQQVIQKHGQLMNHFLYQLFSTSTIILASPSIVGSSHGLYDNIGSPSPEAIHLIPRMEYRVLGMFLSVTQSGIEVISGRVKESEEVHGATNMIQSSTCHKLLKSPSTPISLIQYSYSLYGSWLKLKCKTRVYSCTCMDAPTGERVIGISISETNFKEWSPLNLSLLHPFEEVRSLNLSGILNQLNGLFDDVEGISGFSPVFFFSVKLKIRVLLYMLTRLLFAGYNSFSSLQSLEYLSLADNNFTGLFSFSPLANLNNLKVLKLSSPFGLVEVDPESTWEPLFQLSVVIYHFATWRISLSFSSTRRTCMLLIYPTINYPEIFLRGCWRIIQNLKSYSCRIIHSLPLRYLQCIIWRFWIFSDNDISGVFPDNIGHSLPESGTYEWFR
ncbi:unnamed protein product [Brassica oleracea]